MIPTMIVVGLFAGLLQRPWNGIAVLLAGIGWVVLLILGGTVSAGNPVLVISTFLFGAVNALAGAVVSGYAAKLLRQITGEG